MREHREGPARHLHADRHQRRSRSSPSRASSRCSGRTSTARSSTKACSARASDRRRPHDQYWRLVTSAFLHENFLHIGFNMYLLYLLGMMLEPAIGSLRFARHLLHRAARRLVRRRVRDRQPEPGRLRRDLRADGRGRRRAALARHERAGVRASAALIVINLVLSFTLANISVGAHIGGLDRRLPGGPRDPLVRRSQGAGARVARVPGAVGGRRRRRDRGLRRDG